jgi:hypothetical protein
MKINENELATEVTKRVKSKLGPNHNKDISVAQVKDVLQEGFDLLAERYADTELLGSDFLLLIEKHVENL